MTQYTRIARLLTRNTGATAMALATMAGTVSPHSRLAEMRARGWTIWRETVPGETYGRYFGTPPACK